MSGASMQAMAADYARDGYYSPLRVLTAAEAAACRRQVEVVEARQIETLGGAMRHKPHLILTCLDGLIRNETLLNAIEALIGPNILCWTTLFFTKEANDPAFVSWHQDSTYWGLNTAEVVTAWVAFSPSTRESGAMRVLPGTHRAGQLPHEETYAPHNLLTRGQHVRAEIAEQDAIDLELAPGEASLHHVGLIHGSGPNRASDRRIGFTIRYIPTSARQLLGKDSAVLVRGEDAYGHFAPEPPPACDLEPAAVARYLAANERHNSILYAGATHKGR